MKIYLDMCCFNRPFDDQAQARIKLESDAKLEIQSQVRNGDLELVWSEILDLENDANPFEDRREQIVEWRELAASKVALTEVITNQAQAFEAQGMKPKDSLHLACAIAGNSDVFLTTDDRFLRKRNTVDQIQMQNPLEFVLATNEDDENDD